jgi:hypothetical protein
MSVGPNEPRRRPRLRRTKRRAEERGLATLALMAIAAAGCAAGPVSDALNASPSPTLTGISLATSIETAAGSWAAVPMGHLDQPLNTFWQLFFRPNGGAGWSDKAEGLGVATNGGLLLATGGGQSLAVGVQPANLLHFSPLLVTSNGGSSFSPVTPVATLAQQPDALAVGAAGQWLALTTAAGGQVFESAAGLASWHELTTTSSLGQSAAGRTCGIVAMTAVAVDSGRAVIGADCSEAGEVGIFASADAWRLAAPRLPAALDHGTVTVLGLQQTDVGLRAALEVSEGHDTSLVAAWTTDGGATWSVSSVLGLGSRRVLSIGPDGPAGLFVLASLTGASDSVEVVSGPGGSWRGLPSAPASTQTLVFGPADTADALAVNDTVFTDWKLTQGATGWMKAQVIDVPIAFGSST